MKPMQFSIVILILIINLLVQFFPAPKNFVNLLLLVTVVILGLISIKTGEFQQSQEKSKIVQENFVLASKDKIFFLQSFLALVFGLIFAFGFFKTDNFLLLILALICLGCMVLKMAFFKRNKN